MFVGHDKILPSSQATITIGLSYDSPQYTLLCIVTE